MSDIERSQEAKVAVDAADRHAVPYDKLRASQRLGAIMKRARLEQGLSLMKLSTMTGVSRRSIRVTERGEGKFPSFGTLLKLAPALGLTLVEIAEYVDGPKMGEGSETVEGPETGEGSEQVEGHETGDASEQMVGPERVEMPE